VIALLCVCSIVWQVMRADCLKMALNRPLLPKEFPPPLSTFGPLAHRQKCELPRQNLFPLELDPIRFVRNDQRSSGACFTGDSRSSGDHTDVEKE
jgi:hypothetical protein